MGTELPEQFHAPLGKYVATFAHLEFLLEQVLWVLQSGAKVAQRQPGVEVVSLDQFAMQIITTELSFRAKLQALAGLHDYRNADGRDSAFTELLASLKRASKTRDSYAHSIWAWGEGEAATRIKSKAKEKKGLQHEFETLTVTKMQAAITELDELGDKLNQYMFKQCGIASPA
jgi:hypothetical protein